MVSPVHKGMTKHGLPLEIALKFNVPPERLEEVRRALEAIPAQNDCRTDSYAIIYIETPQEFLARHQLTLFLEGEGAPDALRWKQILQFTRKEDGHRRQNSAIIHCTHEPVLDLARHDGTVLGEKLVKCLRKGGYPALNKHFSAHWRRTGGTLTVNEATIMMTLHEGVIEAEQQIEAVCELHFKIQQGERRIFWDTVENWVERFALILDTRTLWERGSALAQRQNCVPPRHARPLLSIKGAGLVHPVLLMLQNTLNQILTNASQLANGPATPEHLHQLRIGIRRFRSVVDVFGSLAPTLERDDMVALNALFKKTGNIRTLDALAKSIWPMLREARAPLVEMPATDQDENACDIRDLLRSTEIQRLWLKLTEHCQKESPKAVSKPLRPLFAPPLQKLCRKIRKDTLQFPTLTDPERHRLRKRVKRLRYAAELVQSLWPHHSTIKYLHTLEHAQEPLGELIDTTAAIQLYQNLSQQHPEAWFAMGWLTARHASLLEPCAKAVRKAADCRAFWTKNVP
jgi:triphosphatase